MEESRISESCGQSGMVPELIARLKVPARFADSRYKQQKRVTNQRGE
jgi:hypothetical protein